MELSDKSLQETSMVRQRLFAEVADSMSSLSRAMLLSKNAPLNDEKDDDLPRPQPAMLRVVRALLCRSKVARLWAASLPAYSKRWSS